MTDAGSASAELTVDLGDDYVATVEISRPPNNFFNVGLIEQIAAACQNLAAGGQCRAIVLCSDGRASVPALTSLTRTPRPARRDAPLPLRHPPLRAAAAVVAAVQGAAIGGGSAWPWPQTSELPHLKPASPPTSPCSDSIKALRSASRSRPSSASRPALELLYTGRRIDGHEAARDRPRRPPRGVRGARGAHRSPPRSRRRPAARPLDPGDHARRSRRPGARRHAARTRRAGTADADRRLDRGHRRRASAAARELHRPLSGEAHGCPS